MAETEPRAVVDRLLERKRELEDEGRWMGQRELARRLDVAESTVSQWFNGVHAIEVERYPAVAELLGVNAAWLVWEWGPKYPQDGADLAGATRRPPRG